MKTILRLIVLFLFLNSTQLFAQKSITKQEFEKIVDYANCMYVKAFIEKNDKGKPYYTDTYEKKIKKKLENVNIEKPESIIDYKKLLELLSNNSPAAELAKRINNRKLKYDEFSDDETLIKSLSTTGWINIDLSGTALAIQNKLRERYKLQNNMNASEGEIIKTQTIQTLRQVDELLSKVEDLQEKVNNLQNEIDVINTTNATHQNSLKQIRQVIFGILFFFMALVIIIFFYFKRFQSRDRDKVINYVLNSERIDKKFLKTDSYSYKLTDNDRKIIVEEIIEKLNKNSPNQIPNVENEQKLNPVNSVVKYLFGLNGKTFSRVQNTPENTFFKLINENGDVANFEFFGDAEEAIAKRIFADDICTIVSGGFQNAKNVQNIEPGKLKRVNDKWEVVEPLKIKLI
ncbi:MAG TPA: hypothetical protein PLK32_06890 [Defluviitoga tunisiensis]|nr:hypothetical protein [Defluviitoga tunisiensis]HPD24959.1 hypothetical protein [Bacteroidales bacterium]